MKWKIGAHVLGALVVIGLASSSALAVDKSSALIEIQSAKKVKGLFVVKVSGGLGGKVSIVPNGSTYYDVDEGHNYNGDVEFIVGNVTVTRPIFTYCPVGRGTRTTQTRATCRFDTRKDDSGDASFTLGEYANTFSTLNNAFMSPRKKSNGYQPIDEPFTLESGKIASKARVFDGFSKYTGSFKATFKGKTQSGKKLKAQFKLIYKSAERNF